MRSVVGENKDFDLDATNKSNSTSKKAIIKSTINNLDKKYSNVNFSVNQLSEEAGINEEKVEPETVVVDLDMLYQEKAQQAQNTNTDTTEKEENDDLADFLSEFKFDEEETPKELFNEELFNEIIKNKQLKFTETDLLKINQLVQLEIDENLIEKLRKNAKEKIVHEPTQKQRLEELVSSYSINQGISFSNDDIKILSKLMNVEISDDFTKDLSTNPIRTKAVEKEIKESKPIRKSEILTLNVKDLLPDLSKELKKQGNKKIESEAKPEVVYFSEGYEYKKLSVSEDLSDIAKALNNKNNNVFKPSYEPDIVETGYDVSTLAIEANELPDLADVKAHPNKYEDKQEKKVKIDEKALLKSLSNVTFKPFYDEVQEELNQFDNFEIINSDDNIIDNAAEQNNVQEEKQNNIEFTNTKRNKIDDDAKNLLKLIEEKQAERELRKMAIEETKSFKKELEEATISKKCLHETYKYNNEESEVIKSVQCKNDSKCMLVKHKEGYSVIGQIKNKAIELKKYDSLKNPNIQIRIDDKNNSEQYLVKISNHKFVIRVTEDNMEFIMDLC